MSTQIEPALVEPRSTARLGRRMGTDRPSTAAAPAATLASFIPPLALRLLREEGVDCRSGQFNCEQALGQGGDISSTFLCCPSPSFICSAQGGLFGVGSGSGQPFDAGTRSGSSTRTISRWYYDAGLGQCRPFQYNGQAGNFNNFGSQAECLTFCAQVPCVREGR